MKKKCSNERGKLEQEGLVTKCSFSFANYYDPNYLGIQRLKVLNENELKNGAGFEAFNKEMILYFFMLDGRMEYEDEKGNRYTFLKDDGVIIYSGSGLNYYLKNISSIDAHFYQFWFLPENYPLLPKIEKRSFSSSWGNWTLIGSFTGREGSLPFQLDCDLYTISLNRQEEVVFDIFRDRFYWIQIAKGNFVVQGNLLQTGDGVYLTNEDLITISCQKSGSLFLIDLS